MNDVPTVEFEEELAFISGSPVFPGQLINIVGRSLSVLQDVLS